MFPEMNWQNFFSNVDEFLENVQDRLPLEGVFSKQAIDGVVGFSRPVGPIADSPLLAPLVGVAGILAGLLLAGVALGSLGALLGALLALGFLLARVYGVSFELAPFATQNF